MEQEWKRDNSNKPELKKYITLKENLAIPDYVSILLLLLNFTFDSRNMPLQRVRDGPTGQTRSLKLEERVWSTYLPILKLNISTILCIITMISLI